MVAVTLVHTNQPWNTKLPVVVTDWWSALKDAGLELNRRISSSTSKINAVRHSKLAKRAVRRFTQTVKKAKPMIASKLSKNYLKKRGLKSKHTKTYLSQDKL